MNLDQIEPNLFLGSCPDHADDVESLRSKYAITAVLNVQTDKDMEVWGIDWATLQRAYERVGIVVKHEPVRDYDVDALQQQLPACVRALQELCEQGHVVYVHCTAGINRSPTIVIAYLHHCQGWELADALAHVLRCRVCKPFLQPIVGADWSAPPADS